ncbi:MAG: type B DNA-directed DNA polymerase [Methanoregula sp.]|jgi:DNA polymerase I
MWILDSAYRDRGVDLWTKDEATGTVTKVHAAYDPPFYVHFHDPDAHTGMIEVLEDQYGAGECTIRTIHGDIPGYAVCAGRDIAEAIERQAEFGADLYDVDVRRDQRYLAEQDLIMCTGAGEDRFSPDIACRYSVMEICIRGDPALSAELGEIKVAEVNAAGETTGKNPVEDPEILSGEPMEVLGALFERVVSRDPDVLLMPDADTWMPKIRVLAQKFGLCMPFSRNGRYRMMEARSYWSYGRVEHKVSAIIPDGRILIDTEQSMVYREGGLDGVLMVARLSGLSPNLAARFTPGTLVSSYEIREALRRGIAIPYRKNDAEQTRSVSALQAADRGGMMFQPDPGIYECVDEIDFTSMYPSIIVNENLSPETVGHKDNPGFLPTVLAPLLDMRKATKLRKKADPRYAGADAVLKWMLVTCFGYTGYRNAKFGRIEVHEGITGKSREILMRTKEIAESRGFRVLHGIVDCLWLQRPGPENFGLGHLKAEIEREFRMSLDIEHFDWIVFLPLADGFGAYNRYYGRLSDGSIKIRGIATRRHDTPGYISRMQDRMLEVLAEKSTVAELENAKDTVAGIYRDALEALPSADPRELVIRRRIGRLTYSHRCLEGSAVQEYRDHGIGIAPGMKIQYVVTDARRYQVRPGWCADTFDLPFYRGLAKRAYVEIAYAFDKGNVSLPER